MPRCTLLLPLLGQEGYVLSKSLKRIPKPILRIGESIVLLPYLDSKVLKIRHSVGWGTMTVELEPVPASIQESLLASGWKYFEMGR